MIILNTVILIIIITLSTIISCFFYDILTSLFYFDFFEFLNILLTSIFFYLILLSNISIYYKTILRNSKKEDSFIWFSTHAKYKYLQNLRIILDTILIRILYPVAFLFPQILKIYGANIGKNFTMSGIVYNPDLFEAGNNVIIGVNSIVTCHVSENEKKIFQKIKLGDNTTIGVNSVIMPGVIIDENSLVASGSVVTKFTHIPSNEIWGGVPAKKICSKNVDYIKAESE